MVEILRRLLAPLQRRIMLIIGRAVIKAVNDDSKMQALQISLLNGELRDGVERVQNYGFTSHPHNGAEGVCLFVGGDRSHGLVIAVDDRRYRLKGLKQGEVAIYSDEGDSIVLKRGNEIEINTKHFEVNTKTVKISNGKDDLISVISSWMDAVTEAKTMTQGGPQPLVSPKFEVTKQQLKEFHRDR